MSKILKYQEMADLARPFELEPFTEGDFREEAAKKEELFISDHDESEASEFIKGGFSFDIRGGLRSEEILRRSTIEADNILKDAKREADAISQTAHTMGYEAGKEWGELQGRNLLGPLIDTFTALTEELTTIRSSFYSQAEEEMINLVVSVARTVIGIELESQPELIRSVILHAVEHLQSREEMTIRINPADKTEAEELRPELAKKVEDIDKVIFRSDLLINRGGCLVETNIGAIDARLETQLESIRETFITALNEARATKGAHGAPDDRASDEGSTELTSDDENADT